MLFFIGDIPSPGNPAASHRLDDHGVFVISLAGRTIGNESYEIRSSSVGIEAKAQGKMNVEQEGRKVEVDTSTDLITDLNLQPQVYTLMRKGTRAISLEVDFRIPPAKSRLHTASGDDNREFDLVKDVVVLDDNVIHHYQLLVDRYRLTAGGKQTFRAYIPQEAIPGTLTVEDAGIESVEIENHSDKLGHLVVTSDRVRIDLWVDRKDRLQRVAIPDAQLEAVRKR